MNPYRKSFYQRQAEWHGYGSADEVKAHHEIRLAYYVWLTRNWLPESKSAGMLDLGCGAGQFVYFLKKSGYSNIIGIDTDINQIHMACKLGLDCRHSDVFDYLRKNEMQFDCISALDILEHFTISEMHDLLELISMRLAPGGRLILSVPNAESPQGLSVRYGDITHENAFSLTSMSEALFCHNLKCMDARDPWPTPIDFPRMVYRCIASFARRVEGLRLKILGLSVPKVWSPVFWMLAVKKTD